MTSISDRPCWMIMHCGPKRERCPAFHLPETPCWTIARDTNDYRRCYNVCCDCLVRVIKQKNSILSDQEIKAIVALKDAAISEASAELRA
jgi:hypothetical protein